MLLDCDALNVICYNGFSASLSNGSERSPLTDNSNRMDETH